MWCSGGDFLSHYFYIYYFEFLYKELSFSSHIFIYSVTYLIQHGPLDIYFILWVITQYYHFCSNCFIFGCWELFQVGFCVLLTWVYFFFYFSTFLISNITRYLSCIFSIQSLYFTTAPRNHASFYWRMAFKNRNLSTRCASCY